MIKAAGFVVIGGNGAAFGVGATVEDALADAAEWMDDPAVSMAHPATAALIAEIKARRGAIGFTRVGNIYCTDAEEAAQLGDTK